MNSVVLCVFSVSLCVIEKMHDKQAESFKIIVYKLQGVPTLKTGSRVINTDFF